MTHNERVAAYVAIARWRRQIGDRWGFALAQNELLKLGGTLTREERPSVKREARDA